VFASVRMGHGNLDIGELADALVYYGHVNLFVSAGALPNLLRDVGFDPLIQLLDMGALTIHLERHHYGVRTEKVDGLEEHYFSEFHISGNVDGSKIENARDELMLQFTRSGAKSESERKQAQTIADRVVVADSDVKALQQAMADAKDRDVLLNCIAATMAVLVPAYSGKQPLKAEIATMKNDGFVLLSNIDFDKANRIYHQTVPPSHSSITKAYLLSHLLDTARQLRLAADSESDAWIDPIHSALLQSRVNALTNRLTRSDIAYFHDVEFENRTFRQVIGKKEKTMGDLVALLKDQDTVNFKAWLAKQDADGRF